MTIDPDLPPPQPGEPEVVRLAREVLAAPEVYGEPTLQLARGVVEMWARSLTYEAEADACGIELREARSRT